MILPCPWSTFAKKNVLLSAPILPLAARVHFTICNRAGVSELSGHSENPEMHSQLGDPPNLIQSTWRRWQCDDGIFDVQNDVCVEKHQRRYSSLCGLPLADAQNLRLSSHGGRTLHPKQLYGTSSNLQHSNNNPVKHYCSHRRAADTFSLAGIKDPYFYLLVSPIHVQQWEKRLSLPRVPRRQKSERSTKLRCLLRRSHLRMR